MNSEQLEYAQQIIGHRFADPALLEEAFTHASIAESRVVSNERLEFLGDAVLGAIACEHIFRLFPDLLEGDMTKIKSAAVSRRTCATIARKLGLDDLLRLGKGMQKDNGLPSSLSAAVLESVIGALYLDAGLDRVREFLDPHLDPVIRRARDSGHHQNFKSVLQQFAQQRLETSPCYLVLNEKGPDHQKSFEVCVEIDGRRFESCWGGSKKQAEQQAALNALQELSVVHRDADGEVVILSEEELDGNGAASAAIRRR